MAFKEEFRNLYPDGYLGLDWCSREEAARFANRMGFKRIAVIRIIPKGANHAL